MSGSGAPTLSIHAPGVRVGIIASSWHVEVMDALISAAQTTCASSGATSEVIRVPGSYELPLACQLAAQSGRFDALVALGVVIRGGTPHFEYVCAAATEGLMRVGLNEAIPIGFGLLTCDNEEQALDRAGLPGSRESKGAEATETALAMVQVGRALG
ncbi:MAG: hypothetical protein RJB01_712 [Actinomycetota bacterium]